MTRPRKVQWADETSSSPTSSSSNSSSSSSASSIADNHTQPTRKEAKKMETHQGNELVRVRQFNRFAEQLKYEARLPQDSTTGRPQRNRFDRNLSTVNESCEPTREDDTTA